jgi:hypothetical protein
VLQYFRKLVKAGNGTNLFAYVDSPINGTFKFLLKAQHDSEAKEYLKKATSELAKRMSQKSMGGGHSRILGSVPHGAKNCSDAFFTNQGLIF